MPIPHHPQPTDKAGLEAPEHHRSRRLLATLIATGLACMALAVQAPVAGASITLTTPTPNLGLIRSPATYSRPRRTAP